MKIDPSKLESVSINGERMIVLHNERFDGDTPTCVYSCGDDNEFSRRTCRGLLSNTWKLVEMANHNASDEDRWTL